MKIFIWDPFGMVEEDQLSKYTNYIRYEDHIAAIEAVNAENAMLQSRTKPNHVVMIDGVGHYVNDAVKAAFEAHISARASCGGADLIEAAKGLKRVVESIDGTMKYGTWRDDHGNRLKDVTEWVRFYNAVSSEGYVLVPIEPTAAMMEAALEANQQARIMTHKKALALAGEALKKSMHNNPTSLDWDIFADAAISTYLKAQGII